MTFNEENRRYLANVADPLIVESEDSINWDDSADIVVVGFGGAGAAAAIEGLERSLDVVCVDRFDGGGSTRFSGGVTYAGGTRFQKEAGFDDSAENMYNYLSCEEHPVKPETMRRFCDASNDILEWLASNGVPYSGEAFLEKTPYPPEGKFLYYTGNEKLPSSQAHARPVPRGHRAVGAGWTGYVHYGALRMSAEKKGVRTHLHSPVRRLVTRPDGTVVGVEVAAIPEGQWKRHMDYLNKIEPFTPFKQRRFVRAAEECAEFEKAFTSTRLIRARGGVIISAGGFLYNRKMVEHHHPAFAPYYMNLVPVGSIGDDGSGIELGRSAGGATDLMDNLYLGRNMAPPSELIQAALVDMHGKRFISEDAYNGFVGAAVLRAGGKAWLILDSRSFWQALRNCLFPGPGLRMMTLPNLLNMMLGGTRRAPTIAKLARKIGIPAAALQATIGDYNAAGRGQISDPLGKDRSRITEVIKAPFYAINMNMSNKFALTFVFTLGGLTVNEETGNITRKDGTSIPGLYGAGRSAVGLCSKSYFSGMSLSDTVFSGRRAAISIWEKLRGASAAQP